MSGSRFVEGELVIKGYKGTKVTFRNTWQHVIITVWGEDERGTWIGKTCEVPIRDLYNAVMALDELNDFLVG